MPLPSVNKVEPTLDLKPTGDVTRNPKQGYQWPHKNDSCPPKIFLKQECLPALCRTSLSVKFSKKKKSYCCHLVLTFDIRICGPPGVNI